MERSERHDRLGAPGRRRRGGGRSRHLHQLRGVNQGLLRRARRRGLHVVERRGDVEVGVGARRADFIPAGSASRTQHRIPARRTARRNGRVGSQRNLGRPRSRRGETRAHHSLEGALLGPHAIYRAADREHPCAAPRRPCHRPSRSAVGRRAGGRRFRIDRVHHQDRQPEP